MYYETVFIQSYFSLLVLPGAMKSAWGQQNQHSREWTCNTKHIIILKRSATLKRLHTLMAKGISKYGCLSLAVKPTGGAIAIVWTRRRGIGGWISVTLTGKDMRCGSVFCFIDVHTHFMKKNTWYHLLTSIISQSQDHLFSKVGKLQEQESTSLKFCKNCDPIVDFSGGLIYLSLESRCPGRIHTWQGLCFLGGAFLSVGWRLLHQQLPCFPLSHLPGETETAHT